MDNVILPPPRAGEANEAPVDGPKKPWVKPSIKIINQRLALVENGPTINAFVDENDAHYRPS